MLLWLLVVAVGLLSPGSYGQDAVGSPEGESGFNPTVAYSPPSSQGFFTPSGELAPPPPNEVPSSSGGREEYAPSIENFMLNALAPPPTPASSYGPPGYAPPPPFAAAPLPAPPPTPQLPEPSPPAYASPPTGPSAPYPPASPAYAPPPPPPPATAPYLPAAPAPPPSPATTYGAPRADVLDSLDGDPAPTSARHRYFLSDGTVVTDDYPREGSFRYSYLTPEGMSRTEIGTTRVVRAGQPPVAVVRGSYSYVAPDGRLVRVQYNADENGYTARTL